MANPEAPRSLLADTVTRAVTRRDVLKGCRRRRRPRGSARLSSRRVARARPRRSRRHRAGGAAASAVGSNYVGSNHSDPGEAKGMARSTPPSRRAPDITVVLNTVDHGTFQDQITSYLGRHAGHRVHLVLRVPDEVLRGQGPRDRRSTTSGPRSKSNYTEGFATSVVGDDGKVYGIPVDYYPWAVFYRKSVFADKKLHDPRRRGTTSRPCARKMQTDGLTPIAFGDKDGWPAMGTFDILNLRINGYQFHVDLMAGKEKWTDAKVTTVFQKWADDRPVPRQGLRRPDLAERRGHARPEEVRHVPARPVRLGAVRRRPRSRPTSPTSTSSRSRPSARRSTPRARSTRRSTSGRSAPSRRTSRPRLDAAKAYMEFWAKGSTQVALCYQNQPGPIPAANDADTSTYTALQKKAAEIVGKATRITQFLDRDTRPDFAGANGMQSFLQKFLANPSPGPRRLPEDHPGLLGSACRH